MFQSCDGCDADGPDNCLKCAEGYSLKDNNFCVVDKTNTGNYDTTLLHLLSRGEGSRFGLLSLPSLLYNTVNTWAMSVSRETFQY